ncbi:MAG: hypothetical protein RhofKO_27340 [Rhodothermales bacterium]
MSESPFDDYLELSDADREALRAYVVAHSDQAGDLEEAELLRTAVDIVKAIYQESLQPTGEAVLRYVLYTRMLQAEPSSPLAPLWNALDERASSDVIFRGHVDRIRQDILAAEPKVDAIAQFERLSGHQLQKEADSLPRKDRAPRRLSAKRRRAWHWAVACVVGFLGVYGVLLSVSHSSVSSVQRLALLGTDALGDPVVGPTRGASPAPPTEVMSTDELFRQATRVLRNAEWAPLGLFPHYDADSLAVSIQTLEAILSREDEGSFYIGQAYFVLGQVYLLMDDAQKARAALEDALANGTQSATLAERQLDALSR